MGPRGRLGGRGREEGRCNCSMYIAEYQRCALSWTLSQRVSRPLSGARVGNGQFQMGVLFSHRVGPGICLSYKAVEDKPTFTLGTLARRRIWRERDVFGHLTAKRTAACCKS